MQPQPTHPPERINHLTFRNSRIIYYGPHECANCGVLICKMGHDFGGNAFTYPTGPIYPNTEWHPHVCDPRLVAAKPKPTIADLERILQEPDCPVTILPNGEVEAHPYGPGVLRGSVLQQALEHIRTLAIGITIDSMLSISTRGLALDIGDYASNALKSPPVLYDPKRTGNGTGPKR